MALHLFRINSQSNNSTSEILGFCSMDTSSVADKLATCIHVTDRNVGMIGLVYH